MSFYFTPEVSVSSDYSQVIAYARDGVVDVFQILIIYSYSQSTYSACFYFTTKKLSCFFFGFTFVWIGLWTNFSNIITLIGNDGDIIYENI